jgi:trk system potassium uptake protein TrkA
MVANNYNVPCKIARVRNVDYTETGGMQQQFLGIDFVVNADVEVARSIVSAVERGAVSDVLFFKKTDLQMRSITVDEDSLVNNKTIEEIRHSVEEHFLVAGVIRQNDYIIPSGNFRVHENDKLYLIAGEAEFMQIFPHLGKERQALNKITLVGGSRIGQYVTETLLSDQQKRFPVLSRIFRSMKAARQINIIESDYETCKTLSDRFEKAMVIHADISDENFSEDEHFVNADLVIATTENQELNIVNAVYAKTVGARRTIALVNRSHYVNIAASLGIDVVISPISSMVNTIMTYINESSSKSVHNITGGNIDVIEISVEEQSKIAGKKIRELRMPANSLIISLTRNGQNIIPSGNIAIERGDSVIVIAKKESVPKAVEALGA